MPGSKEVGVAGLIEKPKPQNAPSRLASIGRYVLTPDVFEVLRYLPKGAGGEIQLADALNIQAKNGLVDAVPLKGQRFDCGSIEGFMKASAHEYKKKSST